uniref:Odorranain-C-RA3 peptide n=1 Tax=Odorrana andersonii TaxID=369514 RepID=E3SZB3_ODOAN|nr:odorranain-C-RA3 peptide precursor [Odorrana andersonii]
MFTLKKPCYSFSFLGPSTYLSVRMRQMPKKKEEMKKLLKWKR